jgi:hypothetical protein
VRVGRGDALLVEGPVERKIKDVSAVAEPEERIARRSVRYSETLYEDGMLVPVTAQGAGLPMGKSLMPCQEADLRG